MVNKVECGKLVANHVPLVNIKINGAKPLAKHVPMVLTVMTPH